MSGQASGHRPATGTSHRGRAERAPDDRKGKNPAMNEKRKWRTAGRLRRGAVILAAAGLTAGLTVGAGLLTAGSALASVGTPGELALTPTTGLLTSVPTWATTVGCPSSALSAEINEYTLSGTAVTNVSGVQTANITSSTGFSGSGTGVLEGPIGELLATSGGGFSGISASNPGTVEWVVDCYTAAGATGTVTHEGSIYVSVASGATSYTTSSTPPAQTATTTTLSASPNPAGNGASVTLTATETPATSGTVTFMNGATVIASGVAVNASGVATTSFTTPNPFTSAISLSATFTPSSQSFGGSSGTTTLNSNSVLTATNSPVDVSFTIGASGSLTVTVASPATASLTGTFPDFTGQLPNVTITDTFNNYPGWSVMGQEGNFTSSALPSTPISGNQLGWVPAAATGSNAFTAGQEVLGGTVTPASPGLGTTAAVLAFANPGFGSDPSGATSWIVTAQLNLVIPASTSAGSYSGDLTITYLTSGP